VWRHPEKPRLTQQTFNGSVTPTGNIQVKASVKQTGGTANKAFFNAGVLTLQVNPSA
jgi:hypothetical protein